MANNDDQTLGHGGPSDDAALSAILSDLTQDDVAPPTPPGSIWAEIERRALHESETARDETAGDGTTGVEASEHSTALSHGNGQPAPVTDLSSARSAKKPARVARWLSVAAAVVVALGVGTWALRRSSDTVVAEAELVHEDGFDPLGVDAMATAQLIERDGHYEIVLENAAIPDDTGPSTDLELWLIEARDDGSLDVQPVSLLADGTRRLIVPDDLDPATHNIVDISIEQRDGDPAHSGRSILRGPLRSV